MIQKSPILTAIKNGVTSRILGELEKLAEKEPDTYGKIWDNFGAVVKEGIYEDRERSEALLALCRFKTTTSAGAWRSLKDYTGALKENQTAIYYLAGDEMSRIESSPHLEGFRARGIEVLLLADPVDSFWVTTASYNGKPFKSVTQGAADLGLIPRVDAKEEVIPPEGKGGIDDFLAFMKTTLADSVSEVRASDRLTDSAVCLVAPEFGFDRQLEKMMAGSGRPLVSGKPVLEVNPHHHLVTALAAMSEDEKSFKEDAAHLLLDEARVLDGEPPKDPRLFADRLARVMSRSFAKSGA
jgi:molecular chaperone HtpG